MNGVHASFGFSAVNDLPKFWSFEFRPHLSEISVRWVDITDEDYFVNVEGQVRDKFAQWEVVHMLPVVKMVLARAEVSDLVLRDYPVEGYYYKSPELRELFKRVRNIQQNEEVYRKVREDDILEKLRSVYDSDLFGIPSVSGYPWSDSPLKRRWDLLTYVMQSKEFDDKIRNHPWAVSKVMEAVSRKRMGLVNLVELAALIGKPKLLTAAAETNGLGRMYACVSGSYSTRASYCETRYRWLVSPEVEELGTKIVDLYNKTMVDRSVYESCNPIVAPHENNMYSMVWGSMELPRVAHLGYVIATKENYFWIVDYDGEVFDYYTTDFLTTEIYKSQQSKYPVRKQDHVEDHT